MMKISRELSKIVEKKLQPNKVVVLIGARRLGKTFMIKDLLKNRSEPTLILNGEDIRAHEQLSVQSIENYRKLLGSFKLLYIDEAQKIPDIGQKLKLMVDEIEGLKIIVTASSSFDIINKAGEPLAGRKFSYHLFPLSELEYKQIENPVQHKDKLQERLVYGNYPELLHLPDAADKREYLNEMLSSYLLKDILMYEDVRNSEKILLLLRMIAFQLGSQVSLQELGNKLMISKNTVEKYLDLLCKMFVLHKVNGFGRNLRNELTKSARWYFVDNGVRNAVVANFNPIESRNDMGQLWENYLISERLKHQEYKRISSNNYFWRTYQKQEINWVEEREGSLFAYEFKWTKAHAKVPPQWEKAYPDSSFEVINQDNYLDWLGVE